MNAKASNNNTLAAGHPDQTGRTPGGEAGIAKKEYVPPLLKHILLEETSTGKFYTLPSENGLVGGPVS